MFYTFGTSLTLLFWKVWGNGKSGARAFANYAWIPSAERKKCLAALLVETTSTWFQVPSVLPIVPCRPIVFALLFFFLQIERKWMDAHCPLWKLYISLGQSWRKERLLCPTLLHRMRYVMRHLSSCITWSFRMMGWNMQSAKVESVCIVRDELVTFASWARWIFAWIGWDALRPVLKSTLKIQFHKCWHLCCYGYPWIS